ncbi:hypothetical protein [Paraburkholderia tropica]|uniref:hypothetical protein n=1 Tax=Paraburkholderia tropica TaxID=92647 RepID=UPI002AB77AA1|nr:hypothetical protein [Paraburkholderia tropica]
MPAGIQIRNDNGTLQIDGVSQHMVLLRSGVATTGALSNSRGDVACSTCQIAQNGNEILAIQAGVPFSIAGRYGGNTTVNIFGAGAGYQFSYWVFGGYTPSGDNFGILLKDGNGTPIWDSGRPPMRVIGDVAGLGDFTVGQAGRSYALAVQLQYGQLVRQRQAIGTDQMLIQTVYAGFASINGQAVHVENTDYLAEVVGPIASSAVPDSWDGTWANNLQNTYTVLDVTHY